MWKLVKASIKTVSGTVLSILFAAFTTKIIAVLAGTAGIGLFSVLRQTQQTLNSISTLNGNTAIVQGISIRNETDTNSYLKTILNIFLVLGTILSISIWFTSPILSKVILNNNDLKSIFLIRGLIPPVLFATGLTYFNGILNGHREIGKLALIQVISAFSSALIVGPFIMWFGNTLGLLYLLWTISGVGFLSSLIYTLRCGLFKDILKNFLRHWDRISAYYFLKFAIVSSVTGLISTGTTLLLRTMLIHHGGMKEAGIFDVAWTLSYNYLMILLGSLGTYYMPVLSSSKDLGERKMLIERVLRLMLFLTVPLITFVIFSKTLIINILYSKEFLPAVGIIQWMLIADYFKAISWVFAIPMISFADMKTFFWVECLSNIGIIVGAIIALFVFNQLWIIGLTVLILYVINLIFCYNYTARKHNYHMSNPIKIMWLFGFLIVILVSFLNWDSTKTDSIKCIFIFLVLIIYTYFGLKKDEKDKVLLILKRGIRNT